MYAGITLFQNVKEVVTGTGAGSYSIPANCTAIFVVTLRSNNPCGVQITVAGKTRGTGSASGLAAGSWLSDSAIGNSGESFTWSFNGSGLTTSYRIVTFYKTTVP